MAGKRAAAHERRETDAAGGPGGTIARPGRDTRALTASGQPRRYPAPVYVHGRLLTEKGTVNEW